MEYPTDVLGRGIVRQLQARVATPVLVIGADRFTRVDLAGVACFNFVAAARLSAAIKALGGITNTRDLYHHVEPESLALPGIGAFCFAVLGACFEIRNIGTLHDWVERSRKKGMPVTTLATIKTHISKTTTRTTRQPRRQGRRSA